MCLFLTLLMCQSVSAMFSTNSQNVYLTCTEEARIIMRECVSEWCEYTPLESCPTAELTAVEEICIVQ